MKWLKDLHEKSDYHRQAIIDSGFASCFYCLSSWDTTKVPINEWIDREQTALCPYCGIDSVLPEAREHWLLVEMNK